MVSTIRHLLLFCLGLSLSTCYSIAQSVSTQPKLVVGIVIDQMRNEYIHRYYIDFGELGFKRLMQDGFYYANTHYNYSPTYTAPGHASIYTGATPSLHGIIGNYWYDRKLERQVYCTEDENYPIVGGDGKGMSCNRVLSTTVSDELKMSTNERGKVISVSLKDRGAILPAGHMGDAAYWFSDDGNFVSSTYYMDSLPPWVTAFNERRLPLEYFKKGWDITAGKTYDESLPDNNNYENLLGGKASPEFPYDLTNMIKSGGIGAIRTSPYGNDLIVDLVEEAIKECDLGQDEFVDMLNISFSSTDYVGHSMGPRAMETQDTYIRLDKSLARLLKILDREIGLDNYLIFLTSDHGVAEVPQYLIDRKVNAGSIGFHTVKEELKEYAMETWGENVVKNCSNFNIHLNREVIRNLKLNMDDVKQKIYHFLMAKEYIQRVYLSEDILRGNDADPLLQMIFNGFDPKQSGDMVYVMRPGHIEYKKRGTTHGTPYVYDTHVPLIWYGWGINPGRNYEKKFITQIAPTLAQKIYVGMPSATEAILLDEILD